MPVGTAQVGPADLSKTELRTEASAPLKSGSSIDHVWFVLSSGSRQTNHPNKQTNKQTNKTKVKQHTKLGKTNGTMQKQRFLLSADDKLAQPTNETTQKNRLSK